MILKRFLTMTQNDRGNSKESEKIAMETYTEIPVIELLQESVQE